MSVKGEYPLAPGLLHRLLASRRMTRVEFEQKINLSHGVLSKAFGGGNIRYEITETIADFFQVKARALRMGIIFSQDLDLTVMRAYRMVALHCRPGGDFAEISIEEDMVAHIKKWSRRDFRDLNLKEPEFRRLIFALDGRCFIRRSDGRYMRLTGSESGLCASIIGAVTETVMQSANYDIGPSVAKLISADFASDEEIYSAATLRDTARRSFRNNGRISSYELLDYRMLGTASRRFREHKRRKMGIGYRNLYGSN